MGVLTLLQTALLAVIVIAANYLSVNHHARLDLSRTEDYSLSPATTRYLESDAVSGREKAGEMDHGIPAEFSVL